MANPGGNYPGRQIGVGELKDGKPAFTYLVTGRSKGSQERYASPLIESPSGFSVRIKPKNPAEPFDDFRHYQAVVINPKTGTVVLSNSQAPVVGLLEALNYHHVRDARLDEILMRILTGFGPEYDNPDNPTPRILGSICETSPDDKMIIGALGITEGIGDADARAFDIRTGGRLYVVQTYNGEVQYSPFDPNRLHEDRLVFILEAVTPQDLAEELFEKTDYIDPNYGDLRACVIAGVKNGKGPGGWEVARKNRYPVE